MADTGGQPAEVASISKRDVEIINNLTEQTLKKRIYELEAENRTLKTDLEIERRVTENSNAIIIQIFEKTMEGLR